MHVQDTCQLLDFLERGTLEPTLQRAEIGTTTHRRKILLGEISAAPDLFERQAKRDIEFQFAESAKGTMKRYRAL